MLVVIFGGSGSGKSEYAENTAMMLRDSHNCGSLLYIAAMKPFGDEAFERIKRHRNMRKGKGFETIECYSKLKDIDIRHDSVVLIECMSNLAANEIFEENNKNAVDDIVYGVKRLVNTVKAVVVVTNDVFSDGICYDESTAYYIKALAEINNALAAEADSVVEVICGIPVSIKNKELK